MSSTTSGSGSMFDPNDPLIARDWLAAIVRSADDAIISKDVNAIVTSWNGAAERLYGYTAEEIVGRPISLIVPSDRKGEEKEILRQILDGQDVDHYETQRVTRDGRLIDVSLSASPIHNASGEVVGASVIARDIGGRRELRGAAERLAAIVEGSDDAIYSKDERGIVDSWNRAAERLYGYTSQEAIGRHIRFIVPLDRKGEETEILERILAGERFEHFETQRLTKSGDVVDVSISVSPIRAEEGRITGASVIARDIRDRKRLEELQRSVERTEFIAHAAHELRSPIATMTGFASLLAEGQVPEEERAQALDSIARQGERLHTLISDLLDLSYVESGRYQMKLESVRLRQVVRDALQTADGPSGKNVSVEIAEDCLAVADEARLGQVFVNLLVNAYKYGGDNIRISEHGTGGRVTVEIADDGEGVPAEVRDSVFEPFVRGHRRIPGSGLGLAICARLMEAQGGRISLLPSEAGAAFLVELKRAST